jgi:imidazoleglycerol-phosphate dehydratase
VNGVELSRETRETRVRVALSFAPSAEVSIRTGVRMLDHLLEQWAFHSRVSLSVEANSLDAIGHHLIEDVALVLGQAIDKALGERRGIARFGDATIVMDDALIRCALDLGGRSYARIDLGLQRERLEDLSTDMVAHFFSTVANNARIALHLDRLAGSDEHHIVEGAFKAFARASRAAWNTDDALFMPSTKGVI